MNINSIKPGSSTILILNYLGMRQRSKEKYTTATQIAEFFSHKFQTRTKKTSDVVTCLNRLVKAGFVDIQVVDDVLSYSITTLGLEVPFKVAFRMRQNNKLVIED